MGVQQRPPQVATVRGDGRTVGAMIDRLELSERVRALHEAILQAPPALCPERALLVTRFHKQAANRRLPAPLRQGRALAELLGGKAVNIWPDELLVGNFTSQRVGGGIYPELHGVAMLEDLARFERRAVNPLVMPPGARRQLLTEVMPFWLRRFIAWQIRPRWRAARFVASQLSPTDYLINETAGVSHFVPDYRTLLERGTAALCADAEARLAGPRVDAEGAAFLRGLIAACQGLQTFADGYRVEALRLANEVGDAERGNELQTIAQVCGHVPRQPARTLQEGLQAILLAQIALNLESLDNAISPGRLDQVLWPLYRDDLQAGRLDRQGAFDLLACFALKLCEIIPIFSERFTRFHGGLFNGQVVVVGGVDAEGKDCTNELSLMMVRLMAQLRTRQPNWHARLHPGSPPAFRARIAEALADGAASPALYNDEVIVPSLQARGIELAHARDYATVGCVEPVAAGRSFLSTDAALLNLPLALEWALNEGRAFGSRRRSGVSVPAAAGCGGIDEVCRLLERQLEAFCDRLVDDLQLIEAANARAHPTPLTSALLEGCLDSARDASSGGARYNGSGVQGVGIVEVGDALAAIEHVVFSQRQATMADVVAACRSDFVGHEGLRRRLQRAPKFGNDDPRADVYVARVMEIFNRCLSGRLNTRGGAYVPGYYSVTCHRAFGAVVGALPSGRAAGEPYSSGLSPGQGRAVAGPTAVLMSQARLPLDLAPNGVNFNIEFEPWTVAGKGGRRTLQALIDGAFDAGCMQLQVNVLDPQILIEARDHPGRHRGLLVRVSGYSACFDDLAPDVQQEIIDRLLAGKSGCVGVGVEL